MTNAHPPHDTLSATLRRLRALVRKETHQMLRDPSTLLMGIFLPMLMLLLFGYGLSLDVRDVPVAIVVETPSPAADDLASGFTLSPYFKPVFIHSLPEAEAMMQERKIDCIVRLRGDFGKNAAAGNAGVQLLVRGTDANRARAIQIYASGAVGMWTQRRLERGESAAAGPVVVEHRLWYNDANDSHYFLVPGLVVIVMTLIGAFLTSMVVAREWERGTFEALFVTPVRSWEILVGKAVPYFCLGMIGMSLCVASARILFHIPLRGSIVVLTLGSMVYLLVALGMGLVISALTRNQFLASQYALLVSFLPATMLSGFLFDLRSMPAAVELLTRIIPARYYVTFVKTVFLTGDIPQVILKSIGILAVMAFALLYLAQAKTRKSLEK
ncbi:MAG TPA: ABC transporter permease [Opitutales bacterium]|nr:ABC transporter permease [Opitutales bacterium]